MLLGRKRRERVSLPWEQRANAYKKAFSRIRVTHVFASLAILGALVGLYADARERSRERDTEIAIFQVKRAIDRFRTDLGRCPRSTVELVHPPTAHARYLELMPTDGWNRDLLVRCPGYFDPNEADVISAGPSGSFFDDDNID